MKPGRVGFRARALTVIGLALSFGLCLALPTLVDARQSDIRRVALVITNDSAGPDVAPAGAAMSKRLSGLGFEVTSAANYGRRDIDRAGDLIEGKVDASTVVVIYYAGYGVRANGRDYLLPAGAAPQSTADLATAAVDLTGTIQTLRDKGALVVVILDACRRSPVLAALGGVCAGDPLERGRDVYLVSAGSSLPPGDLTDRVSPLIKPGRSVADIFDDVQAQFGASAVVQTPSRTPARATDNPLGRAAPAAPAPPAPVAAPAPYVPAPAPPPAPETSGAERTQILLTVKTAVELAEDGDFIAARKMIAGVRERYAAQGAGASALTDRLTYGQLSYVAGDYEAAVRDFDAARQTSGFEPSLKLDILQGTAYTRLGRFPEAIVLLERAKAGYQEKLSEEGYVEKLARVRVRLGEAYRRAGRTAEAKVELESARRDFPAADNSGASMQLALLALDQRDWVSAERHAARAVEYREGTASRAGLAEALVAVGRAKFGSEPTNEAQAWNYVTLARKADPTSAAATQFASSLPQQLLSPSFESMRPRLYNFDYSIESQARSCYETTDERDAYLTQIIGGEIANIDGYVRRINEYLNRLTNLNAEYQRRGYDFYNLIMTEHAAWTERSEAATSRSKALVGWHIYAAPKIRVCGGEASTVLPLPPGYQRNGPVSAVAAPTTMASAPPPATVARASPPPAAPVVTAPPPTITAPPPGSTSVALLTPPRTVPPAPAPAPVTPPPAASPPSVSPPPPRYDPPPAKPVVTSPPPAPAPTQLAVASPPPPSPVISPPPAAKPTPAPVIASPPPAPAPKPVVTPPPVQVAAAEPPRPAVTKPAPAPVTPPAPKPTAPPTSAPPPAPAAAAPVQTPPPPPARLALATPPPMGPITPPPATVTTPPPATTPAKPTTGRGVPVKPGKGAPPPAATPAKPAPSSAQREVEAGRALLAKSDAAGARAAFDRALALEPASADALDGRGYALLLQGDDAGAQRDIIRALELRPNFAEARYHLGLFYQRQGLLTPAITQLDNAIALDPKLAGAYVAKGKSLEAQTRLADAIASYELALRIEPANSAALEARGRAYFQMGDFARAHDDFSGAIQINAFSTDLLYERGRAELALKRFDDAVATFEELVLRRSDYASQCSRAVAYLERGGLLRDKKDKTDFKKAYDSFAEALKFKPKDPDATNRQTYAFSQSGNSAIGVAGKLAMSVGAARKPSLATLDPDKACAG